MVPHKACVEMHLHEPSLLQSTALLETTSASPSGKCLVLRNSDSTLAGTHKHAAEQLFSPLLKDGVPMMRRMQDQWKCHQICKLTCTARSRCNMSCMQCLSPMVTTRELANTAYPCPHPCYNPCPAPAICRPMTHLLTPCPNTRGSLVVLPGHQAGAACARLLLQF